MRRRAFSQLQIGEHLHRIGDLWVITVPEIWTKTPPVPGVLAVFGAPEPGGLVAYADDRNLIGRRYDPSETLSAAFEGRLGAELN